MGESERRIRQATQVIDAFGKAVIWLDEVEKMFSGTRSSGETDGGTTASMFGHFLTWMAETTSPILVMATANNIAQLPPKFMRAGRFDATFFVDLPTKPERIENIKIMNRKWKSDIPIEYADKLTDYTGAEIEQLPRIPSLMVWNPHSNLWSPCPGTMREDITTTTSCSTIIRNFRGLASWRLKRSDGSPHRPQNCAVQAILFLLTASEYASISFFT